MTCFVLVPGAGLGPDAFADVSTLLRARGHDVRSVTLRGLGDRADEADERTGLRDHVQDVVDAVGGLRDVVLVGHSYAASVVWESAPQLEAQVSRVVLLGAVPPAVGRSAMDELPPEAREQVRALAEAFGDGWRVPPFTRERLDAIWDDHGFDDRSWARYEALATGHPLATMSTPVTVPLDAALDVQRTHIACLGDPGPVPELPAPWEQLSLGTGHWPMLTAPELLADALEQAARPALSV